MVKHGTRSMYTHYGCRCEACCMAEHQQYLKRKESKSRKRTRSKWGEIPPGDPSSKEERRREAQRKYNKRRYIEFKSRPSEHTRPISWVEIAKKHGMKCAICGCIVDPDDTWIGDDGRKRYGRKYPTVDHIIPLKLGGADKFSNVQLACKHCNSSKGAKAQ